VGALLEAHSRKCSEALHVLDRFHIVSNMNKTLEQVRTEEAGRLKREGRDPVLKKSRWLLLRRRLGSRRKPAPADKGAKGLNTANERDKLEMRCYPIFANRHHGKT